MQEMIIRVKNKKKVIFLKKLLSQFDFVEIEIAREITDSQHSIFNSAGLWAKREKNELNLRETAWRRGE